MGWVPLAFVRQPYDNDLKDLNHESHQKAGAVTEYF